MALAAGARLGPYEVLGLIGVGGMGEVYQATDTRLDRTVAIKVLPSHLSDPEHRARFEREAKTIATLSHSHICTLHDVGEHEGSLFLVMEHLEGQTLAERLRKGALPIDRALDIGAQIADALSAAHRAGIIHRDLKPANVMLTKSGVKLLDFGLAKLTEHGEQPAAAQFVSAPTRSTPLTAEGVIVGTLQYMAPEQIEGRPADARTDLWALGAILYEMVTGKRAFEASSAPSLIGAILEREPAPLSSLQPLTPPAVDRVVRQCLAKSPDERPDTAHDVANDLRWIRETSAATNTTASPRRSRGLRWAALAVAAIAFLVMGAVGKSLFNASPARPPVVRFSLDLTPADYLSGKGTMLLHRPGGTSIALSPDGHLLVFSASQGQQRYLYARPLDQEVASPVKGSEGGEMPFFSPDGGWIGFWADGVMRRVPTRGGPTVDICRTGHPSGVAWDSDNTITFGGEDGGLWQVSASGGAARPLISSEQAMSVRYGLPHALPGGRGVLYTSKEAEARDWSGWRVMVLVAATGERRQLLQGAADARYVPTGHLLFVRAGKLLAVPFDLATLRVTGEEVAVADDVMQDFNSWVVGLDTGAAQVAVADAGVLALVRGGIVPDARFSLGLLRMDGTLARLPLEPEPHPYVTPRLSPDGRRVVAANGSMIDPGLWVFDLQRGSLSRPVVGFDAEYPIWTPDGRSIVFSGTEKGRRYLFRVPADGSGPPGRMTGAGSAKTPACWGRDGQDLVAVEYSGNDTNIIAIPMNEPEKARTLVRTSFEDKEPAVSPDNRWLAYSSAKSGRSEVYVQPYAGGEVVQVSAHGGGAPLWSRDGHRLFYRGAIERESTTAWTVHSVAVSGTAHFVVTPPRTLGAVPDWLFKLVSTAPIESWQLMPDGKSFLVVTVEKDDPVARLSFPKQIDVVLNWLEELKAKVPVR